MYHQKVPELYSGHNSSFRSHCKIFPRKLCATWPLVTEDLVDDALEYTDLDPTQAPQWSIQLQFNHSAKTGLARSLNKLLKIWNMDRAQEYYLDQVPSFEDDSMGGAFDQLTQFRV